MKKLHLLMAVFFAISFTACAGILDLFSSVNSYPDATYMKASLYEQEGNYEEASRLLEAILDVADDEYVYLKLANAYSKVGDNEMVKYTLERAVRKWPSAHELIALLADTYSADQDTVDKAIPLYQRAYELTKNTDYIRAEARAFEAEKDFNSAIRIYNNLIKMDSRSDDYVHRGMSFEKLGLNNEAIRDYKTAVDIDGSIVAAAKLAGYYLDHKDTENAVKYLELIVSDSPELTIAKFKIAALMLQMGRLEEGEKYFLSIIDFLNEKEKLYIYKQLGKNYFDKKDMSNAKKYFTLAYDLDKDIQTAYSLAVIAESTGDAGRAKGWYELILKVRPDFAEASKRLAIILLREDKPKEALAILANVDEVFRDVTYYRLMGLAYSDLGDNKKAEEILRNAIQQNPAEVQLYIDLALSVDRQGDKAASEDVIKSGLKLFPEEAPLLNFLGYLYAEQGIKLDEAEKLVRKALGTNPDEAAYLDSLAWIYYQRGNYSEAYKLQKKAVRNAPKEPEIIEHMKDIMKKLGIKKEIDEILKED